MDLNKGSVDWPAASTYGKLSTMIVLVALMLLWMCITLKHAAVPHNTINYFERLNWCFQRNQDEGYVQSCYLDQYAHNWIYLESAFFYFTGLYTQSWCFKLLSSGRPFSLSVAEHMVDIMRFECAQEMKRIYHLDFLLGKYLLFPEPSEMESDHGWPLRFRLSCSQHIPDGATASTKPIWLGGFTGVGKQTCSC